MQQLTFDDIYTDDLGHDAIINREFIGFENDYKVLHCLIRKYKPKSFFEIGCNMGTGTKIIKNAIGDGLVYSLDLPFELTHKSLKIGDRDLVGHHCDLPFTLLRGDSLTFNFSHYPCEGYFIDGCHDEVHVDRETTEALKCNPLIVTFHDSNIPEVMRGIISGWSEANNGDDYELYRVVETRISYLLKVRN